MIERLPSTSAVNPAWMPGLSPRGLTPQLETTAEPCETFVAQGPVLDKAPPKPPEAPPLNTLPAGTTVLHDAPSPNLVSLESQLRQASTQADGFLVAGVAPLVQSYRQQARQGLADGDEREVEQTALQLFERDLSKLPTTLTMKMPEPAPPDQAPSLSAQVIFSKPVEVDPRLARLGGLAASGAYTANLAAVLGSGSGSLAPAVFQALSGFDTDLLLEKRSGGWRYLGTSEELRTAAETVSQVKLSGGARLLGAWSTQEIQQVEAAMVKMEQRLPGSAALVKTLTLGSYLGGREDSQGKQNFAVAGLDHGQNNISLVRANKSGVGAFENTVFHEVGHEKDRALATPPHTFYSRQPGSPFLGTRDPDDYVSGYATILPEEDFAETHADLLTNFDRIMGSADLCLWANGALGSKRRDILEKYGQAVPPPSQRLLDAREKVKSGDSPFGWKGQDGSLVAAEADFEKSVKTLLKSWQPGQPLPWYLTTGETGAKNRWIVEKLTQGTVESQPPSLSPMGFGGGFPQTAMGGLLGGMAAPYAGTQVMPSAPAQDIGQLAQTARTLAHKEAEFEKVAAEAIATRERMLQEGIEIPQALLFGVDTVLSHYFAPLQAMLGKPEAEVMAWLKEQPEFIRNRFPQNPTLDQIKARCEAELQEIELDRESAQREAGGAPRQPAFDPVGLALSQAFAQCTALRFTLENHLKQGGPAVRQAVRDAVTTEMRSDPRLQGILKDPPEVVMGQGYAHYQSG